LAAKAVLVIEHGGAEIPSSFAVSFVQVNAEERGMP